MVKKYVFIRLPIETHKKYVDLKKNWETKIKTITHKPVSLTMTKVYEGAINPEINPNLKKLFKIK